MPGYVGNANDGSKYAIFEFTKDGDPLRPVSQGSLDGAAWASPIVDGSNTRVYGSVLASGVWGSIHRWSSIAGAPYVDDGAVLTANASEPYGIGPGALNFDGTTYRLFYLIRGAGGPGVEIALATSTDGLTFTRQGIVYTCGSEAPGGASLSFACTIGSASYLLIHAYAADLQTASSFIASAASPDGPYTFLCSAVEPSGVSGTATGSAGNNFISFTGNGFTEGVPVVIQASDISAQPYIPKEISGNSMWLDRPLECSPNSAPIAQITRNKVDLSYISQLADGTFEGAVTGYGSLPVLCEYTVKVIAPAITGPWTFAQDYLLKPYFGSGAFSTENPEPIISGT